MANYCVTLELEANAELGAKGRAAGRDLVAYPVSSTTEDVALLRYRRQRRGNECAVVRVGIEIAAVCDVVDVGDEANLVALAQIEVLANAHVPGEEIGLAGRVASQQERLASKRDHRPIIVRELIDNAVAILIHGGIGRVGKTAVSDEVAAPTEAMGQIGDDAGLELVCNIETIATVIDLDVERILRPEERVRIALAGVVAEVARPAVIGEELEVVGEALVSAHHELMVVAVAEAGKRAVAEDGNSAVCGEGSEHQGSGGGARPYSTGFLRQDGTAKLVGPCGDEIPLPVGSAETSGFQTIRMHEGVVDSNSPIVRNLMLDAHGEIGNPGILKRGICVIDGRAANNALRTHLVHSNG